MHIESTTEEEDYLDPYTSVTPIDSTTDAVTKPDFTTSDVSTESTTDGESVNPVESTTEEEETTLLVSTTAKTTQGDVIPPVCEQTKDISRSLGPNADPSGTPINFKEPRATDDTSEPILVFSSHAPRDRFPAGTTRVTYTYRDNAGNTVDCGFNVILTENYLNMNFSPAQVNGANRNYDALIRNMGNTFDPELLREPEYYNTTLLPPLTHEQELLILDRYSEIFINITEYERRGNHNHPTGNQDHPGGGRGPRQTSGMSRVCEVKPPSMSYTYLVTTSDTNELAQLAQLNSMDYFQWTFNEECVDSPQYTFSCKGSMRCHCGKAMRYQPALVFVFSRSGRPTNAILKTVKITSCVPMM
ncbi:uncharacterized protein [Amphiura filiformis]|uniref:uncharacterized protein n=1 Tax=Amphiura filiformis TaxID=82378 RepID=UPI003B215B00